VAGSRRTVSSCLELEFQNPGRTVREIARNRKRAYGVHPARRIVPLLVSVLPVPTSIAQDR